MKKKLDQIISILKKPFNKRSQKNTSPETESTADKNQEAIEFIVRQKNEQLFEIFSPLFPSVKGLGTTPKQALSDLFENINLHMDHLIKNAMIMNINNDEIQAKFNKTMKNIDHHDHQKKNPFSNIRRFFHKEKKHQNDTLINIYLKEKQSTENLLEKLVRKEFGNMDNPLPARKKPEPSILMGPNIFMNDQNRIILKTEKDLRVPIHMLFDSTEEGMDDILSFGIVVSLN